MTYTAEEVRYCVESLIISGCSNSRALTRGIKMLRAYADSLERRAEGVTDATKLRAFAQDVMRTWPYGGVDGGELQEAALRHGLLEPGEPTPDEIAEWGLEDGDDWYRRTALLSGLPVSAEPAQPADSGREGDAELRQEWRDAGGSIHGPNVETVTMPEADYFAFRRALAAQGQGEAVAYFAADPANADFNKCATLAGAIADAEKMLGYAQDHAADWGWADEPPQICYGIVLGRCVEKEGSRRPAPEGSEFAELVDYRLTEPRAIAASPAGVPEAKVVPYGASGEKDYAYGYEKGHADGWNACLKHILTAALPENTHDRA